MNVYIVALIPIALCVLVLLLVRWLGQAPNARWAGLDRVMPHVVGIIALLITGACGYWWATGSNEANILLVPIAVFGFVSYQYIRRLSGQ
jgi:hypothetical protein